MQNLAVASIDALHFGHGFELLLAGAVVAFVVEDDEGDEDAFVCVELGDVVFAGVEEVAVLFAGVVVALFVGVVVAVFTGVEAGVVVLLAEDDEEGVVAFTGVEEVAFAVRSEFITGIIK